MRKARRASHPRVNCCITGCKRGTTRLEPNANGEPVEWICGEHWRQVPKSWRTRMSLFGRRYRSARRKGDVEQMHRCARLWWQRFDKAKALFDQDPPSDEIPPLMAEQLRKDGLL